MVKAVMDSPTHAALGTASELAKAVGVHEATASRLARKLGYTSYAAFKGALRDEFLATRETATRFEKTIAETSSETILGSLVHEEAQALSRMETYISADQINAVARQLMLARRIFVYGHGNAEILALLMLKRFRRFGKDVHKIDADSRSLAEQAVGFQEGDVVLTFVFRRAPQGYAPLIETAREAGATNIVISGITGTTLSPRPDYSLAAPRSGHPDAFQTLTVPMAICNAVVIAAGLTAKEESLQKLEKLGQLIERFE
ncbi:MAG: MurR/RpiR family transcriptional regulator [Hyphomicrobiales bacterium]